MKFLALQMRILTTTMILTWKQNVFDAFIFFTLIIQPLVVALIALWMLKDSSENYAMYVVVGSGMSALWSGILFAGATTITAERWLGTLENVVAQPTPVHSIMFGKTLAVVIQSLFSMLATYCLASLIIGYPLSIAMPMEFIISLVLAVISLVAFGLTIAPLFFLNPLFDRFINGLEFPVFIFSAFLFPILLLPKWSIFISGVLPTYWAADALHIAAEAMYRGERLSHDALREILYADWLILLGLSCLFLLFSFFLFSAAIKIAAKKGNLHAQ